MDQPPLGRLRARWAAIGAAIAVSIGGGGLAITNAAINSGERDAFVPMAPCRLFDARPGVGINVGPRSTPIGSGEIYTQQVTGTNGNCVVPADATAVAMNVTAVGPTADGYLTVFPADVGTTPLASNLNTKVGAPPTPNKVDVKLSPTGAIKVFNFSGTVNVLADVVGYYADHIHDDRYYTKAEVYTKPEIDASQPQVVATQSITGADFISEQGFGVLDFTTDRAGHIFATRSWSAHIACIGGTPVVYLVIDGVPVQSSEQRLSTGVDTRVTLSGVTPDPLAAGVHTLSIGGECTGPTVRQPGTGFGQIGAGSIVVLPG